jgi:galactonate dehydratase
MKRQIKLDTIEFASVRVTQRTEWTFAILTDDEGVTSIAEITRGEATGEAVRLLAELLARLKGRPLASEMGIGRVLGLSTAQLRASSAHATAVSATRTAIVDIQSQHAGLSMTEALGGQRQVSVALYANINRSLLTGERTPKAFGLAAERAVGDGFAIVKCAPFDEVRPPAAAGSILEAARPGLERVAAVRAAVGPNVRVLVDCHSRFEAHTAPLVAEELAKLDVGWFEEPLQPTTDADGLAQVASVVSIPIAGGESGYGEDFFEGLVRRGAVSIIMPDVKHCGGVAEACRAGRAAMAAGGQVSLHSPSGPVSQLASAHATAAMPGALALEHAVNEAPWRAELLEPRERIEGGRLWFPDGKGLGAILNDDVVRRYGRSWKG